ncbi:MAG: hypothetical protein U9R79_01885 [Armatimonadota bacterium]|nr:hypothetical protein [Armatimonadota bacterium]
MSKTREQCIRRPISVGTCWEGGSVWDDRGWRKVTSDGEATVRSDYAFVYDTRDGHLVESVRSQAFREGAEDFRLLGMVREAAGEEEVERWVEHVRSDPSDAARTDAAREALIEVLIEHAMEAGRVDPRLVQRIEMPAPLCLTGNGGPTARIAHVPGSYTYGRFPDYPHAGFKDQVTGVTEGPIFFRAEDAPEGSPQRQSGASGVLTDGIEAYRSDTTVKWHYGTDDIRITFDLTRPFVLESITLATDDQERERHRWERITAEVSTTAEEGSWQEAGTIDDPRLGPYDLPGHLLLALGGREARYVRLNMRRAGPVPGLREVWIWGRQPASEEP